MRLFRYDVNEDFVDANNLTAYDLFRALAPADGNLVFSPASLRGG